MRLLVEDQDRVLHVVVDEDLESAFRKVSPEEYDDPNADFNEPGQVLKDIACILHQIGVPVDFDRVREARII